MKLGFHQVRIIHLPFGLPFPFIIALTAGAILRLVAMVGYPGALWFAGDSYVYLGAALRLQPNLSKTTGYSLFLHVLEPFHSLTVVAGLQHLMGLAVAVMIYLLLRRSGVSQRWSTVATLPVLLDGFVIEDEHMVMAEALFTFLVMLSMLLILWRRADSRPIGWPVALLAGLLAGYAVTVRSEGLAWKGEVLQLGAVRDETVAWRHEGRGFIATARPGDWVAMHWDWACDVLTAAQRASLAEQTARQLAIVNGAVPPPGASDAGSRVSS